MSVENWRGDSQGFVGIVGRVEAGGASPQASCSPESLGSVEGATAWVRFVIRGIPHTSCRARQSTERVDRDVKGSSLPHKHLRRPEVRASEERDRDGYYRQPQARNEPFDWEAEAVWPAE